MAFDPTKIGAGYQYREFIYVNLPTAPATQLCPFNPYRVCILFTVVSANYQIRPNVAPISTSGFTVGNNVAQLRFAMNESGPLCQQAWWGLPNNAANSMYIMSVEWIPEPAG